MQKFYEFDYVQGTGSKNIMEDLVYYKKHGANREEILTLKFKMLQNELNLIKIIAGHR